MLSHIDGRGYWGVIGAEAREGQILKGLECPTRVTQNGRGWKQVTSWRLPWWWGGVTEAQVRQWRKRGTDKVKVGGRIGRMWGVFSLLPPLPVSLGSEFLLGRRRHGAVPPAQEHAGEQGAFLMGLPAWACRYSSPGWLIFLWSLEGGGR